MCTRYYVELSPELKPYIEEAGRSPLSARMAAAFGKEFIRSGEIRPTAMAAVIAPDRNGRKTSFPMIWGYHIEGLRRPVVNARVETAKDKPSFRADWQKHRCVVPASYYFEWEHIKRPDGKMQTGDKYMICPENAPVTWLAGLYRIERKNDLYYPVFTILTRTPGTAVSRIHDRMPLILPETTIDEWISPDGSPERAVSSSLTDMVCTKV